MTDPTLSRLLEAAEEANARIERCHEEVACPRCGVGVGHRCVRASSRGSWGAAGATPLKHPHRERWTQVVAAR